MESMLFKRCVTLACIAAMLSDPAIAAIGHGPLTQPVLRETSKPWLWSTQAVPAPPLWQRFTPALIPRHSWTLFLLTFLMHPTLAANAQESTATTSPRR